jgi:6-phosphogluconolactonase (cycloisomerase 2 family)
MSMGVRAAIGGAAIAGLVAFLAPATAGAAVAQGARGGGTDRAVFVQTDELAGNHVVAYRRGDNGALTFANTYGTGGLGGALNGSVVDHLASQGSLTYDAGHQLLYAVNAGSNSVAVFAVDGTRLSLRQVIGSGGDFPVSIAVHDDLVYVLNARSGGSLAGYRVVRGRLDRIEGSTRDLQLVIPTDTTEFTHTPGQVAFSPDGRSVLVTTKASSNAIDVFAVRGDGRLSASPVVNVEAGTVPFAMAFDQQQRLVVANAGTNAVATFRLGENGVVHLLDAVPTGQAATCWIAPAGGLFYASNAGSASVSGYQVGRGGALTLLGATTTDPGTVDAAAPEGGRLLYVQGGAKGTVDAFQMRTDGSLRPIGAVTVPGAVGGEGIVAP